MRCCKPLSPKLELEVEFEASAVFMPTPSSTMSMVKASAKIPKVTTTVETWACLTTFDSPSWVHRNAAAAIGCGIAVRSEERRVGKESGCGGWEVDAMKKHW